MEINLAQIIFQIINFGVVFGALSYLLYKPVVKTLEKRAEKIEEGQRAADQVIKEKEHLEELKKKASAEAKKEASALIAETKEQVEAKKKELLTEAKQEVKSFLADEKTKWENEKKSLVNSMKTEYNQGVFAVVEKVLGTGVIDSKTHGKLIDQSIQDILKAM